MRFTFASVIRAAPERVFAFHELPDALARLTPPWANVRIVSETSSTEPGSVSRVKIRILPLVWIDAEYLHTRREPPFLFEDCQVRGPFRSWTHRHVIEPHPEGARLVDDIEFEPPVPFVSRRLILPRLRRIFAWRHEATREWCESALQLVLTY
jgi:ligand-binding SRPBCC domain-containing protein